MHQWIRSITTSILLTVVGITGLSGCGGGGGGGDGGSSSARSSSLETDSAGDGLGVTGQIAGSVKIADNGTIGNASVTLDDSGRALAVWARGTDNGLMWNRSDLNGHWESANSIAGEPSILNSFLGPALRTIPSGASVLGWSEPPNATDRRLLRYNPNTAWSQTAIDSPTPLDSYPTLNSPSDLALLSDETIVLSGAGTATNPVPFKFKSYRIFKREVGGTWSVLLETDPTQLAESSHLATARDGRAMFFWMNRDTLSNGQWGYKINAQSVNLATGNSFAPITVAEGEHTPCFVNGGKPLAAVTSLSRWSVASIMHTRPSGAGCNLDLIRIEYAGAITVSSQRMNAPDAELYREPVIRMNDRGDAIAIWEEHSIIDANGVSSGSGRGLLWAQSIQGGPWSNARPLLADLGASDHASGSFSFVMNPAGQAVATVKTIKNGREYIIVGRFSFEAGWSNLQLAAAMSGMTLPNVAINTHGQAVLVYGATPCERLPTSTGLSVRNCRPSEMYAFKF